MTEARIEPDDFDRAFVVLVYSGRTVSFESSRRPGGPWEPIDAADKPKPFDQQEARQ